MTRRDFIGSAMATAALAGCSNGGLAGGKPRLRIGIIADVHIVTKPRDGAEQNCLAFEPTLRFFDRCKADAVLVGGDLTDFGTPGALRRFAEIWYKVFPNDRRSDGEPIVRLFHYGDHDMGNYAHKYSWRTIECEDPSEWEKSIPEYGPAKIWEECFHEKWEPFQVKDVKGYRFVLAHHPLHTKASHDGNVLPGLAEFMAKQTFEPGKPFFYSQHRPAARTVLGPWNNDRYDPADTKAVLKNYPNCIAFFAHGHRNCVDETSLWQGEFTAVEIPSINYCCTRNGRQNSFGIDKKKSLVKRVGVGRSWQALFGEVYDDRIVLHRHDMLNRMEIAQPWVIRLPSPDGTSTLAARAALAVPPEFAAGAKVTLEERTAPNGRKEPVARVVVKFPVAENAARGERAFDYLVTAHVEGGKDIERAVYAPGAYWAGEMGAKPCECHFAKSELPEDWRAKVRFTVTPRDSYGTCGKPLTTGAQS